MPAANITKTSPAPTVQIIVTTIAAEIGIGVSLRGSCELSGLGAGTLELAAIRARGLGAGATGTRSASVGMTASASGSA
jgi:hypothetical protein